jgi:flagellar biosynthesis/type III secretory pathway protein FliH
VIPATYRATRMPAAIVAERLAATRAATEADAILTAAVAEAETIRKSAHADAEADRARARDDAEVVRAAVRDQTVQDSRAMAIRDVLAMASVLEARFDALSPWLEDMIKTAVIRIFGTIAPYDMNRQLVAEALREARPSGTLRLRVHPDATYATAVLLVDEAGIADVCGDSSLAPGACVLDCSGGLLDLSVEAQLDFLLRELSADITVAMP